MIGRVVSTKLTKTATVLIERTAMHPLYKKTYIQSKRYLVHDLLGVKEGDVVEISKCKPISRNKHWTVIKIVGKNLEEITEQKLKEAAAEVISEVMPEEKEESSVESQASSEEIKSKKLKVKKEKEKNGSTQK